jgi:hypothetical protein
MEYVGLLRYIRYAVVSTEPENDAVSRVKKMGIYIENR